MKKPIVDIIVNEIKSSTSKAVKVLDFGCGKGELLKEIKKALPQGSKLTGLDVSQSNVDIANKNCPAPDIEFKTFKFENEFEFENDSFDIIISVDTLECLVNKENFIRELHRIIKKDGFVFIAHWDWDTQVYHSENKELIRQFVHAFSDWQQGWMDSSDGQMGRKLHALFNASNTFEGKVKAEILIETQFETGHYGYERLHDLTGLISQGIITTRDHQKIIKEMKSLYQHNKYFYSINSYIYIGKPFNKK